jgi:hypothetical protein
MKKDTHMRAQMRARTLARTPCPPPLQDLLSALGKGDSGTHGLSPRILHFSGHTHHRRSSDPFLDICFTPGLLVENEAGLPILLTAERIIPTLRESLAMCPRIQCLFLNCCNTTEIAEQVPKYRICVEEGMEVEGACSAYS